MEPQPNRPPIPAQRKIKDLPDLASILADLRNNGRKIVHCHGVFDLLHIGHLRHFEEAKRYGDVLVVTLTPDQWVNKGPHRPAFPEDLRAEMVGALGCVDFVAINHWPTAVETIKLLKPHYFAKGSEYREAAKDVTGYISAEEEAVKAIGAQIVFTEDVVFSSSTLINRHLPRLTKEATDFLRDFSSRSTIEDLFRPIEKAKSLKVLVVGESIIDEYHYCQTLGKAGKEPILAMRYESSENFAGGNLAVANHVAAFTDHVRLLSYLGAEDSQENFARSQLNPNVATDFFFMPNAPTIIKRRYIERYPFQKMFEVYFMKDYDSESPQALRFRQTLQAALAAVRPGHRHRLRPRHARSEGGGHPVRRGPLPGREHAVQRRQSRLQHDLEVSAGPIMSVCRNTNCGWRPGSGVRSCGRSCTTWPRSSIAGR